MPFATTAAIVGGALAAGGSLGGAALAAHGAGKQADAAKSAAELQHEDAQSALAFQEKEFGTQQANEAPWLKAGQGAVTSLSDMLKNGTFGDWTGKFSAPTDVTEQNDPGFQFRLQQGQQALERSAAARGTVLGGGTAKALTRYGQDYGSNEYSNVYNRSLQQYQQGYNEFENNQTNKFNRYASLAGLGQNAASQLGQFGQGAANNISNTLLTSGAQIGGDIQNSAAASAGGYNAFANAFSSLPGQITMAQLLNQSGYKNPNISQASQDGLAIG